MRSKNEKSTEGQLNLERTLRDAARRTGDATEATAALALALGYDRMTGAAIVFLVIHVAKGGSSTASGTSTPGATTTAGGGAGQPGADVEDAARGVDAGASRVAITTAGGGKSLKSQMRMADKSGANFPEPVAPAASGATAAAVIVTLVMLGDVLQLRAMGKTIFLSSHILSEVEKTADSARDDRLPVRHRLGADDAEPLAVGRARDDRRPRISLLELVVREEPERTRNLVAQRPVRAP